MFRNRLFGGVSYMPFYEPEKGSGSGGGADDDDEKKKAEEEAKAKAEAEAAAAAAADDDDDDDDDEGGQQRISDNEAKLLKEVMEKKNSIKALKQELNDLKGTIKTFEGLDPEEARTALNERKEAEQKKLESKGEFEKVKKQILEDHQKVLGEKDAKIKELAEALEGKDRMIGDLTVGNAFGTSKFISDELVLTPSKARVVYANHFDVVDGEVVAYDKPRGSADRAPLVDGKGDNLGFDDAMKRIVDADPDKENLLRSKIKTGAGSKTDNKAKPNEGGPKTGLDKIAAGLANKGGK